jgi:hypothetical protein
VTHPIVTVGVLLLSLNASDARAQQAEAARLFLPGSISVNTGMASPLEPDNTTTYLSVEQGFTALSRGAHRIIPFVTVSAASDRAGFDWNNRLVWRGSVKYARAFRSGVIEVGGGYAQERRLNSGLVAGRPVWFGNYWFGWSGAIPSRRSRSFLSGFPGSSWSVMGTPSPTEYQNNFIGMWSVEQGIGAMRIGRVALVPYGEHTLTLDSAGRFWNNRSLGGGGLKIRVPVPRGTFEIVGAYKHERRWIQQQAASGLTASANLWYGWDPSHRR